MKSLHELGRTLVHTVGREPAMTSPLPNHFLEPASVAHIIRTKPLKHWQSSRLGFETYTQVQPSPQTKAASSL